MTGARLKELCGQEKVIKRDMKPPSPGAWDRLAMLINVLRGNAMYVAMYIDAGRRRLLQILTEADSITDRLLEQLRREAANPLISKRRVEGALSAFEHLIAGTRAVRSEPFFQPNEPIGTRPNRKGAMWSSYAGILATFFIETMQETNPGKTIGIGDNGPVARFTAAVIPFITGEHPKPAAIARHLQRTQSR